MSITIPLTPVDAVRITILMDNVTDPLLFPTEHVERTTWFHHLARPRVASAVTDDGLPDALIAQPGFSALVRVTDRRPRADDPLRRRRDADRCRREHAPARDPAGRHRDDRAQPRPLGPRRRDGGNREGARTKQPSRTHPPRLLASSAHRDPGPRAGRAARDQPLRTRGRGLRDRRGTTAVVPARRLRARDGRGRSHDAVRDRLPGTPGARSTAAGSRTR